MIHYYCDGSYSKEQYIVGCGIIRKGEKHIEKRFRYTMEKKWRNRYEVFAILQTLLMIEEKGDEEVIIYNDCIPVIYAISNKGKSTKMRSSVQVVKQKLKELTGNGYIIHFQYQKQKRSHYMLLAHKHSRKYLENVQIQRKIKKRQEKEKAEKKKING